MERDYWDGGPGDHWFLGLPYAAAAIPTGAFTAAAVIGAIVYWKRRDWFRLAVSIALFCGSLFVFTWAFVNSDYFAF